MGPNIHPQNIKDRKTTSGEISNDLPIKRGSIRLPIIMFIAMKPELVMINPGSECCIDAKITGGIAASNEPTLGM